MKRIKQSIRNELHKKLDAFLDAFDGDVEVRMTEMEEERGALQEWVGWAIAMDMLPNGSTEEDGYIWLLRAWPGSFEEQG